MMANRVLLGILALSATNAIAGTAPLGRVFGSALGTLLGKPLPLVGGGLLAVAAVSLVIGIRIAKRKKNR